MPKKPSRVRSCDRCRILPTCMYRNAVREAVEKLHAPVDSDMIEVHWPRMAQALAAECPIHSPAAF